MDRRAGGFVVLLLAVFAVLVGPQVLRPGIHGQATAAPLPAPPEIGACMTLAPRSSARVDCSEPHDGEVFMTWTADDPERPAGRHSPACADGLAAYLGTDRPTTVHGWVPTVFNASTRLVRAPRVDRLGDRAWAACLIRPANQARYAGTVVGPDLDQRDRPGAFGDCWSGSLFFEVPCTEPHTTEALGTAAGQLGRDEAVDLRPNGVPPQLDAILRQNCLLLAGEMIGAADPTFGGLLTVDVIRSGLIAPVGDTSESVGWSVDCVVRAAGLDLVDSVVGLGGGALPVG